MFLSESCRRSIQASRVDLNENFVWPGRRPRNISECDLIRFAITPEDKRLMVLSILATFVVAETAGGACTGGMPSESAGGAGRLRRS
jgi:hypothetical protein